MSLGRVRVDMRFAVLAFGSDGWGFMMSWVQGSLVDDCGDADQDEDGTCGLHCFGVVAIGEL